MRACLDFVQRSSQSLAPLVTGFIAASWPTFAAFTATSMNSAAHSFLGMFSFIFPFGSSKSGHYNWMTNLRGKHRIGAGRQFVAQFRFAEAEPPAVAAVQA